MSNGLEVTMGVGCWTLFTARRLVKGSGWFSTGWFWAGPFDSASLVSDCGAFSWFFGAVVGLDDFVVAETDFLQAEGLGSGLFALD